MIETTKIKKETLKKYFGFENFLPIQEQAIDFILAGKSILTVLPTGAGKSLIFQLPTLLMKGITIVISPLISLMQDQVDNLLANGIEAKMINSQNSMEENKQNLTAVSNCQAKFLYIAPERFNSQFFSNFLKRQKINFFVIDEAHCLSEWGHEFRSDYRKLSNLKNDFPNTPIACFTATATQNVRNDILETLDIEQANLLKVKIKRKNLIIRCEKRFGDGKKQIINFLTAHQQECGIIYCFTRKETEKLSKYLNEVGFTNLCYHAGLTLKERKEAFEKFKKEDVKIIVATIAFGMGIDKKNIRFVLHTSMPKTLENYYQEIGRAGRDGLNSDVLLLHSKGDEISKRKLIDDLPNSDYKNMMYQKLNNMYRFVISSECRHQYIANYFNDEINKCDTICDNCLHRDKEYQDISIDAQKFLSTILRCNQNFGQNHIINILRESKTKKIVNLNHHQLSVYGIGKHFSKEQWQSIADRLLDLEAIVIDNEYRILKITPIGSDILKGKKIQIEKSNLKEQKSYDEYKSEIERNENFESFRKLRKQIAEEENVPPYIVFHDVTLDQIAKKLPTTKAELLQISGVAQKKIEKYYQPFINLSTKLSSQKVNQFIRQSKKPLNETYLKTLSLVKENKTIAQIKENRELQTNTIIGHIKKLNEHQLITDEKKEQLFSPLIKNFPNEIKLWIEKSPRNYDTLSLQKYLYRYLEIFSKD